MELKLFQRWVGPPDERRGGILVYLSHIFLVIGLSYFSISSAEFPERLLYSVCLCSPTLLLVSKGHLGRGQWQFPTIPGLTYLVWTLGLLPSLASARAPEIGVYFYGLEAKLIGSLGFIIWLLAFIIGAGENQAHNGVSVVREEASSWAATDAWIVICLLVAWMSWGAVAAQTSTISAWSSSAMEKIQGTGEGSLVLLYLALIPLIPIVGLAGWLYGRWRWLNAVVFTAGLIGLILYSNRRLVAFTGVAMIYLWLKAGKKLRIHSVMTVSILVFLLIGPLLWPMRVALANPELISAQENPVTMTIEAIGRYLTDPAFRDVTSDASSENLKGGRFNYADSFLGGVQWTLEHRNPGNPSILYAPVVMVPSVVWPEKMEYADSLNIKKQWVSLGITNEPDFPMTPLQEMFFQFGWIGVLCGGLFWGWIAKKLEITSQWVQKGIEFTLIWATFLVGVLSFENGFSAFLATLREPLLIVVFIVIIKYVMNRMPNIQLIFNKL